MKKRILLVEDNQDNTDLVCAFLDGLYSVQTCRTAMDALQLLKRENVPLPHLFLFDIALPGMDGIDLLRKVRAMKHTASIPAIALTAHAMKGDEQGFLAQGFNGYVSKPILDDTRLLQAIQDQIER